MWTFLPLVADFSSFVSNFYTKGFETRHTHTPQPSYFTVPLGYLFQPPVTQGFVIIPRNFNACKGQISLSQILPISKPSHTPEQLHLPNGQL